MALCYDCSLVLYAEPLFLSIDQRRFSYQIIERFNVCQQAEQPEILLTASLSVRKMRLKEQLVEEVAVKLFLEVSFFLFREMSEGTYAVLIKQTYIQGDSAQ